MKISWSTKNCVPDQKLFDNIASAQARNLPRPSYKPRPRLAVVGGGPSLVRHLDELKAWEGDVWACGSAFQWCRKHGITATFFNVDPMDEMAVEAVGATHGMLALTSAPAVFDAIEHVEVFELITTAEYINHGVTAVTATPILAVEIGYKDISLFGCDSNYGERTHAYKDYIDDYKDASKELMIWVSCGDSVYSTHPAFFMQAELLAAMIRSVPGLLHDRSGGLLSALVEHGDYDIVGVNETTHSMLSFKINGEQIDRSLARQILPVNERRIIH